MAPPSALPKVPVMISILPSTFFNSNVPIPVSPIKPVAWHSSIITNASYLSAKSQISSNLATIPSIENTPSVTIILNRCLFLVASISCASSASILLFS